MSTDISCKIYRDGLPEDARKIRDTVFKKEQGFQNEFDDTDEIAAHIVLYGKAGTPIAVCRVFPSENPETYIIGRLAVKKEYRGQHIGSAVLGAAEQYIKEQHGKKAALHAQCQAGAFYRSLGYQEYGEIQDDEGCPHIWMKKLL